MEAFASLYSKWNISRASHPANILPGDQFHKLVKSVFYQDGVVVEKLFKVVLLLIYLEGVGQQRMPVVKCVKL
jgi:hypothetical protein